MLCCGSSLINGSTMRASKPPERGLLSLISPRGLHDGSCHAQAKPTPPVLRFRDFSTR